MRAPLSASRAVSLLLVPCVLAAQGRGGRGGGAPATVSDSSTRLTAAPLDSAAIRMEAARIAWEDGDFPSALRTFDALLTGSNTGRFLTTIAQITGTAWEMTELSDDAAPTANPQLLWSPSGKLMAFEDGVVMHTGKSVIAKKSATGVTRVREIDGRVAAIAPNDGWALAELTTMSPELKAARDSMARLVIASDHDPTTAQARAITAQNTVLTAILNRSQVLSIVALGCNGDACINGRRPDTTTTVALGAHRFLEGQFAPDGQSLLIVASSVTDSSDVAVWKTDLAGTTWTRITPPSVVPGRILAVSPDGATVVVSAGGAGGGRGGGRGGAGGGGGRGGRGGGAGAAAGDAPPSLWIVRGSATPISGTSPSVSRDVNAVAYVVRAGDSSRVEIRSFSHPDSALVAWRGSSTVVPGTPGAPGAPANPAISPDGKRVAFELTLREDKELYVAEPGAPLIRVTHSIAHDRSPMWLTNDYLIGLQGEPRHTQSFGYDLKTLRRDRLFHNNTIRTIAPEYAVAAAPDGKGMLVVAEADGNTISPERGAYLLDFDRPVTAAAVRARIRQQLDDELALRAKSKELFATLAPAVSAVTTQVSVSRLHDYLDTLTSWGSRYITQPGNRKAIDYIARTLRGFGYDVEIQEFVANGAPTANVVATLRGTAQPDETYVISSHLDSVAGGPGADDDGSGITILLEIARVMKAHPQPATIKFGFFTGEEAGLLGSKEFVRRFVKDHIDVVGALNNDMVGFADDQRIDNTIRYSNAGIRDVEYAASLMFTKLTLYSAKYYKSTDAQSYTDAIGEVVGGIGSYPVLNSPHYHQASDVLETISFPQVAETGKATIGAIMYMASSPAQLKGLTLTPSGTGAKLAWAKAQEKDVVSYQVRYTTKAGLVTTLVSARPSAVLPSVKPGSEVTVRALNAAGRYSWDWARISVP